MGTNRPHRPVIRAEKNERAFAAADFALRQKNLILAESHPDWSPEQVANEARRLVFGVSADSFS